MLTNEWKAAHSKEIEIKKVSYEPLMIYLKFIYGNDVQISLDIVTSVYEVAHLLCDENLLEMCEEVMRTKMSVNNVVEYYLLAVRYETKDGTIKPNGLRSKCVRYIFDNVQSFTETEEYSALDAQFFKEIFSEYAKLPK